MKMKKHIKLSALSLACVSALSCAPGVFAAGDNYGIEYFNYNEYSQNGGVLLQNSITESHFDENLVSDLTQLMGATGVETVPNSSTRWRMNEINNDGTCMPYYYFTVSEADPITAQSGIGFTMSNNQYKAEVKINSIKTENLGDKTTVVGIIPSLRYVYGDWRPLSHCEGGDGQNDNPVSGIDEIKPADNVKMFVDLTVKLYKKNETKVFSSDQMYFGLLDIDAAQSYKILNSGNELTSENMYAKSPAVLQPGNNSGDAGRIFKNIFVPNGHYIYSEFSTSAIQDPYDSKSYHNSSIRTGSNIYVKLNTDTQEEGLHIVFGFVRSAGSGLTFFAKQYTVNYISDENGEITGIDTEQIIAGENPDGTTQEPAKGYKDRYWTANVDVELTDGTKIKAGDPITDAQIKKVRVTEDITFTAMHIAEDAEDEEPAPAVPDTGESTKNLDAATIATVSVFGILALALIIRILPQITRKKVKFE